MGAVCGGKHGEADSLARAEQIRHMADLLAKRPGWSAWGVDWLMRVHGMCPACLEIGGKHDYWCRFSESRRVAPGESDHRPRGE